MNRTAKSIAAALLGCASMTSLQIASAQETETTSDENKFDTIVVTAQRREQNLQDVPLSVTALSGDVLENIAAADITEASKLSPNVTLEVSRGTNTTLTAFIRGVGQQDPVAGFESGVGIYIDDVYLNRPQGAVLDVFDVERIEVLRGPQGTLYGRNTIGGAVKYVTKPLSKDPAFEFNGKFGSFNQRNVLLKGSVPMGERFRVGAAVASLQRDGFGENIINGDDNYDKNVVAARVSAELEPTDGMMFKLSADYTKDESNARQGHRVIPGQLSGAPILGDVFDTRAGLNVVDQEVEAMGGSFVASFDIGENFTLKNILAYREDESTTPIDFDSLQVDDLDVPAIYENDQFSEELQLIYASEKLNGILGAYYLDANASTVFDVLLGPLGAAISLPGLNAQTFGDVGTETWSVYGDFTYDFTDQLSLTLGGRFTHDERTSRVLRRTYINGFSEFFDGDGVLIATTSDFSGSNDWDKFTPRVSLSYKPTPDHNVYATYSQGFKGGGFDPRGQTTQAPDQDQDGTVTPEEVFDYMAFDPEEVDSFELGWKASWGGGRVNTSVAAFYMDYKDVQVPSSIGVDTDGDGVNDSFAGVTSNAAAATVTGLEFEALATLFEDAFADGDAFTATLAAGYIDAEYDEWIINDIDVSGDRAFQNTPDWTGSALLNYSLPLSDGGMINASTTLSYKGDSQQFEIAEPLVDQDAYTLWDLSIVWTLPDEHWRVGLHGKNLTDEEYIVAAYDFVNVNADGTFTPTLGLEGTLTAFYGNPRTITAEVGYRF